MQKPAPSRKQSSLIRQPDAGSRAWNLLSPCVPPRLSVWRGWNNSCDWPRRQAQLTITRPSDISLHAWRTDQKRITGRRVDFCGCSACVAACSPCGIAPDAHHAQARNPVPENRASGHTAAPAGAEGAPATDIAPIRRKQACPGSTGAGRPECPIKDRARSPAIMGQVLGIVYRVIATHIDTYEHRKPAPLLAF